MHEDTQQRLGRHIAAAVCLVVNSAWLGQEAVVMEGDHILSERVGAAVSVAGLRRSGCSVVLEGDHAGGEGPVAQFDGFGLR